MADFLVCNEKLAPVPMSSRGTEFEVHPDTRCGCNGALRLAQSVATLHPSPHPSLPMPAREVVGVWPELLTQTDTEPRSTTRVHTAAAGLGLVALAATKAWTMGVAHLKPSGRTTASTWALRAANGSAEGVLGLYRRAFVGRGAHTVPVRFRLVDRDALEQYKTMYALPKTATHYAVAGRTVFPGSDWTGLDGSEPPRGHLPAGVAWTRVPDRLLNHAVDGNTAHWVGVTASGGVPSSSTAHTPTRWWMGDEGPAVASRLAVLFPHIGYILAAAKEAAGPVSDFVAVEPWFGGIQVTARVPIATGPPPTEDTATFEIRLSDLQAIARRVTEATILGLAPGTHRTLRDMRPQSLADVAWAALRSYAVDVSHASVFGDYRADKGYAVRSNACTCVGCTFTVLLTAGALASTAKSSSGTYIETGCTGRPVVVCPVVPSGLAERRARKAQWAADRAAFKAGLETWRRMRLAADLVAQRPVSPVPTPRLEREEPSPKGVTSLLPRIRAPVPSARATRRQMWLACAAPLPPPPVRKSLDEFLHAHGAGVQEDDEDWMLKRDEMWSRDATTATLDTPTPEPSPDQRQLSSFFTVVIKKSGEKKGSKRAVTRGEVEGKRRCMV